MTITYDKDGAYIEITDSVTGAVYRRSIAWKDCVVSVPNAGTEKIDMVYVNGSDQLVIVLEDESEITITGGGVTTHGGLTGVTADQHHVEFTLTEHTAVGDNSPHHTKYTDAAAKAAAVRAGTITDTETKAPTHDAVYDVKLTADAAMPSASDAAAAVAAMGAKADANPLHHDRAVEWGASEHTTIGNNAPHHAKYTDSEAKTQAEAAKLDDHAVPDDNTDLDASGAKHGLMPKADKTKIDTVATNADVTGSNPPQAHKDLHDPEDGGDKLDTAVPVQVGSANAIGDSHSLARANHVHEREHAKYTDSDAVAAVIAGNFVVRTYVWFIAGDVTVANEQGPTFRMKRATIIEDIELHVKTAPTGTPLIVDINDGGSTVFSTRPEIDISGTTEDNNHAFSDTALAAGTELTMDIDQIGSSAAGADLTVLLHCKEAVI